MRLFDSHCHISDEAFDENRDALIDEIRASSVALCTDVGSDLATSLKCAETVEKYDFVYAAAGCHPHEAKDFNEAQMEQIRALLTLPKVKAWGEIGLDYHYDLSPREDQRRVLEREIALAEELGLPIVFHVREAYEDFNAIIKRNKKHLTRGVLLHCYGGSAELAKYYLGEMDAHFSFGGVLTFAKHKDLVLANIPAERLLLETDCPYMTPVPFRGTPNEPKYIPLVRDKMAELKGLSREEIERTTTENALAFYKIKL